MSNRGTWKLSVGGTEIAGYDEVVRGEPTGGGPTFMDTPGYGAAALKYLDLGNKALTRSFVITKEHADNAASVAWYLNGAQALNGVKDVVITHKSNAGTETVFTISAAKVLLTVEEPINVTTITHLTITGGAAVIT